MSGRRAPADLRSALRLYLVTDPDLCGARGVVQTAVAALRGGATMVQLRDKSASDADLTALAVALRRAMAPFGAPLIVNDRVAVAAASGADGVHLGQTDGSAAAARALLGPGAIIGVSVNTSEHLARVDGSVVDYIGCGPVRATATKGDHKTPIGVSGAAALASAAVGPAVGIGGVDPGLAAALVREGLCGVAVVSALCAAADPAAAAAAFRAAMDSAAPTQAQEQP